MTDSRTRVATEMLRILTDDGSTVVVEFHVGPLRGLTGRFMRGVSIIAELMARHLHRSQAFVAGGGVAALAQQLGTDAQDAKVLAGGNLAVYHSDPIDAHRLKDPTRGGR